MFSHFPARWVEEVFFRYFHGPLPATFLLAFRLQETLSEVLEVLEFWPRTHVRPLKKKIDRVSLQALENAVVDTLPQISANFAF